LLAVVEKNKCMFRGEFFDCSYKEEWEQVYGFEECRIDIDGLEKSGMRIEMEGATLFRDGNRIRLEGKALDVAWVKLQRIMIG